MSDKLMSRDVLARDIVTRLRDPDLGSPRWLDTMSEAAAEIERLRKRVAELETREAGR
jgi:hypothetical protein